MGGFSQIPKLLLSLLPTLKNDNVQVLSRNTDTGEIEYIEKNTISPFPSITIIPDSTVALNIVDKEAYYGIETVGALLSLPPISGNESKKLIIANLSSGDIYLYSNDSVSEDILNFGTETNELTIPSGSVITLFDDALKWVLKSTNVSGTAGQIIATNEDSTTVLSIDPAYTTASNTYADSKVQDTITDGVTDKAPSENAVFDALALKENIQDYLQQHLFNFNFNTTSIAGFINTPLSGGTLITQSDSLTPISLRYNRPNDIVECWSIRGNASSANSGYIVGYTSQNPMYVGSTMFMAINVLRITDTVQRYGLIGNSSLSPLSSLMGNASICVEINNNQLTFKTSTTNISTAPAYTIPSPQWLYVMFEVESLTAIRCKLRLGLTGALVYNEVVSTNLPITQEGIVWNQLRFCLSAVTTVASNDYLSLLGTIKTFAKKPNYLKYF